MLPTRGFLQKNTKHDNNKNQRLTPQSGLYERLRSLLAVNISPSEILCFMLSCFMKEGGMWDTDLLHSNSYQIERRPPGQEIFVKGQVLVSADWQPSAALELICPPCIISSQAESTRPRGENQNLPP